MSEQIDRITVSHIAYASVTRERIYLRALIAVGPGMVWTLPGCSLPDGRIILAGSPPTRSGFSTYSSEAMFNRLHPGAQLHWLPDMDATINRVAAEDAL